MAETWNLDRLEGLLEDMEPEEIRARYGAELAAYPQCLAMLDAFEGLDGQLKQLKDSVPAPPLVAAAKSEPVLVSLPQSPRPASGSWQWTRWAMPLAALLLVGILLLTRAPQRALEQAVVTTPAVEEVVPAAEPAPPPVSQDTELLAEEAAGPAASPVQSQDFKESDKAPLQDVAPPAPARPTLRKLEKAKKEAEQQVFEDKLASAAPLASASQPDEERENTVETQALPPAGAYQRPEAAAVADDQRIDNVMKTRARAADEREGAVPKRPSAQEASPLKDDAAHTPKDVAAWVEKYNASRQDPNARAALFAPGLNPFGVRDAAAWPKLRVYASSDEGLEVEALGTDGRSLGRFRLELDETGRCVALHPK